ncbi:hypothetical protein C8J57DRAFT_17605 [Mycena rebaudengoi]|nr:hypothetical protein C8J57DRAFT_17605 [Mycena rebaudengoi]
MQSQGSETCAEHTVIRQYVRHPSARKSKLHDLAVDGSPPTKTPENPTEPRSGSSQSITSMLHRTFASYTTRLHGLLRRTNLEREQDTSPSTHKNDATTEDLRLQRLMDRRKKEAARAYHNRKVIVTFGDQAGGVGLRSLEKRKREEDSDVLSSFPRSMGSCESSEDVSSHPPLPLESPITRPHSDCDSDVASTDAVPTPNIVSCPLSGGKRRRLWVPPISDHIPTSPDDHMARETRFPANIMGECDTDMEAEFYSDSHSESGSDSSYFTSTSEPSLDTLHDT